MKFVSIFKFDPASFVPESEHEKLREPMERLIRDMFDAGVLVDTGGVLPGGASLRVRRAQGKVNVTDGPFTESKEVVGGFAVFDVRTRDEAIAWTKRFLDIVGNGTCELHEVSETPRS